MTADALLKVLSEVERGVMTPQDAAVRLARLPF